MRLRGHAMGSLTDPATASVVWHTPTFATGSAKWTSTVSSKLLLRNRLLVQPRALRQRLPGRARSAARHARVVCRARARTTTAPAAVERLERAARQLSRQVQRHGGGLVCHRLAQRQSRLPGLRGDRIQRWNTANADLYQIYNGRHAARGDGAEHAAQDRGVSRRELGALRAGFVAPQPLHRQPRAALRLR